MEPVTVFRTFSPAEAQLVRSRLEAAEFHPIVTHELASLTMEGYSMAAGGVLVQVPAEEASDAKALLAAAPEAPAE
jgi:putative signal transducing protein